MSIAFLLTTLIFVVTPGAGVIYTLTAGLSRGIRAIINRRNWMRAEYRSSHAGMRRRRRRRAHPIYWVLFLRIAKKCGLNASPPTGSGEAHITRPTDTQMLATREFDAPKDVVHKIWTTPEHIRHWWTAGRGEATIVEEDLRVGGKWRRVMLYKGGFRVGFHGEFLEVVPNERIVCTEISEEEPEARAVCTDTFAERDGRTTLTVLMDCSTKRFRDIRWVWSDNLQTGWDRIEDLADSLR